MAEHTTQDIAITHAEPLEAPRQTATTTNTVEKAPVIERASTERSSDVDRKEHVQEDQIIHDEELAVERKEERRHTYARYRPFILTALGLLILAWWISSMILKATRHRWQVPALPASVSQTHAISLQDRADLVRLVLHTVSGIS